MMKDPQSGVSLRMAWRDSYSFRKFFISFLICVTVAILSFEKFSNIKFFKIVGIISVLLAIITGLLANLIERKNRKEKNNEYKAAVKVELEKSKDWRSMQLILVAVISVAMIVWIVFLNI